MWQNNTSHLTACPPYPPLTTSPTNLPSLSYSFPSSVQHQLLTCRKPILSAVNLLFYPGRYLFPNLLSFICDGLRFLRGNPQKHKRLSFIAMAAECRSKGLEEGRTKLLWPSQDSLTLSAWLPSLEMQRVKREGGGTEKLAKITTC